MRGFYPKKTSSTCIMYLYYKLTGAIMQLNLYFWKIELLTWSEETKFKFSIVKEGNDVCIRFGRRELWVIPRYSKSFFAE